MKKTMILAAIAALMMTGCDNPPAGTKHRLDAGAGEIEVYRYYYDHAGNWVYVARFADQPKVVTNTYLERQGKYMVTKFDITDLRNGN